MYVCTAHRHRAPPPRTATRRPPHAPAPKPPPTPSPSPRSFARLRFPGFVNSSEGKHFRRSHPCTCNVAKQRALSGTVCALRRARPRANQHALLQTALPPARNRAIFCASDGCTQWSVHPAHDASPRVLVRNASTGTNAQCTTASLHWDLREPGPPPTSAPPRGTLAHLLPPASLGARLCCCTLLSALRGPAGIGPMSACVGALRGLAAPAPHALARGPAPGPAKHRPPAGGP